MEQFREFVVDAWAIDWVRALVVIVASIVVAKLSDVVVCRVLKLVARRTESDIDDRVINILHRPVFLSVLIVGLYYAGIVILAIEGPYRYTLVGFLKTLCILIWATAGLRILRVLLDGVDRAANRYTWLDPRTVPLIDNLAKLVVFGIAVYMLLNAWQLDVKPWLASAGIAGIALGFAAKDTLANIFGGLFIVADAPYKLGDWVLLDSGERGRVTHIGLRSTRLLTREDVEVTVPNAVIANAKIVNQSGGPHVAYRVTVRVGVAYGSDVEQVRRVLLEAAHAVELVQDDPAPRVRFTEFGDSALNFRLLCWISDPVLRGQALDKLNTEVYLRFAAEQIHIPFPQRDLYIKEMVSA
jgi:small-conductance mechanosensitive channel